MIKKCIVSMKVYNISLKHEHMCDEGLTLDEMNVSWIEMDNDKSLGLNGLWCELCKAAWDFNGSNLRYVCKGFVHK